MSEPEQLSPPTETTTTVVVDETTTSTTMAPEAELLPALVLIRTDGDCEPIDPRVTEGGGTFYMDEAGDICITPNPVVVEEPSVVAESESEPAVVAVSEQTVEQSASQLVETGVPTEPLTGIGLGAVAIGAVLKRSGEKLINKMVSRKQLERVEKLTIAQ